MMALLLLLACGPRTDAERLSQALDSSVALRTAVRGCEQIQAQDAQGDCLSAAIELREGTTWDDCQGIESDRWRSEWVFVLAERLGARDVPGGILACEESGYVRECLFHLIQDQAEAVAAEDLPPAEAEASLTPFFGVKRVPDASTLFWKEWVRYRVRTMDLAVPLSVCDGLKDVDGCKAGHSKARRTMLRGVPKAERCARVEKGMPVLPLQDGSQALELKAQELEEIERTCAASKR